MSQSTSFAMSGSERHEITSIPGIKGLYISDWIGASTIDADRESTITHILSVLSSHEADQFAPLRSSLKNRRRRIYVRDELQEDVLMYFEEVCDWIDDVLTSIKSETPSIHQSLLVHCQQGISRSATFVVAYMMRKLKLSYSQALASLRQARPFVHPNLSFEKQLRIWHFCNFHIHELNSSRCSSAKGKKIDKPAYQAWKRERDFIRQAERRNMVMQKAATRPAEQDVSGESPSRSSSTSGQHEMLADIQQTKGWAKVREMENKWNKRLMNGRTKGDDESNGAIHSVVI